MNERYYISSGAKNKMYTLRCSFLETTWLGNAIGSRLVQRDQHVATLSNNKEKAIEKAFVMVGKTCEIKFEVGERDKGLRREYEPNIFRFGKYFGKTVEEVKELDPKYLLWVSDNFSSPKHMDVINYIKKIMEVELGLRESEFAKELALEAEQKFERAKVLSEIGNVLITLPWDFPFNMGNDLIKGNLPKGRGRHLVCDMMGKVQGRRNSKKYKAEYQRVEELLEIAEAI